MSVRHQVDFVSLVSSVGRSPSEALSEVSRGAQKVIVSDPRGGDSDSNKAPIEASHQLGVERKTRSLGGYGSFWETATDILLPGVRETVDAGEGVAKLIVNATTGDTSAVTDAAATEKHTVETISRAESQHGRSETTTSTAHTETFESITRTFANPYRDRSLQLRFIPVFRHFEVRTWPESVTPGISLHAGPARERTAGATPKTHELLAGAEARLDMASLQRPLARMLSPGPMATSIRAPSEGTPSASAQGALLWSQSSVREDSVFVPLAEAETAANALGLEGRPRTSFLKSLAGIRPEAVAKLVPETVQHVHLFMGTHIEAIAGECILQDVPPPSEGIN
jgi:hypothetical protein